MNVKFNFKKPKIRINKRDALIILGGILFLCLVFLLFGKPDNISAQAMEEIKSMSLKIHESFQKKPDYWRLNNEFAIKNNIVPKDVVSSNKIISKIGAEIFIGNGEEGYMAMPGSQSFDIVYRGLSRKNCVILASYNLDYMGKLGLLSLTIKNSKENIQFSWGGENKLPVSLVEAKDACLSSNNTIIWTFK